MYSLQPWKSYRQISTQTAPPGQLVLMLFDGALRNLDRGLEGFDLTDPAQANMTIHNHVERAQEIIRELDSSLDLQRGGDCATTLRDLYRYFDGRLGDSNIRKQRDGIIEVREHVGQLRDAWAEMLARPALQAAAQPAFEYSLEAAFA